ncbi:MAG: hypothetical protein OXT65_02115 [Alphaproteobacteria bacterium]|nr:hypothetical protein [Alphaproteobacteria bacterium]
MRVVFISLLISVVILLPELAQYFDFRFDGGALLRIPYTAFSYMAVFFHEIGHTVAWSLYGYLAMPAFDFAHGGGVTIVDNTFSLPLSLFSFAVLVGGGARLWISGERMLALPLFYVVAFAVIALMAGDSRIFCYYMGHGAEVLVACFCLLRGFTNSIEEGHKELERYLNLVFGFVTLGRNALLYYGLAYSDVARVAYAMQKNGEIQGDFSQLASLMAVPMPIVALWAFSVMVALFAATVFLSVKINRDLS